MYQEKVEFLTKNLEQLQETVLRQQENLQTTVEMIRMVSRSATIPMAENSSERPSGQKADAWRWIYLCFTLASTESESGTAGSSIRARPRGRTGSSITEAAHMFIRLFISVTLAYPCATKALSEPARLRMYEEHRACLNQAGYRAGRKYQ